MDAEYLSFADGSFDKVFCGFALFFFSDVSRALAECRRVLKPKGHLGLSIWGKKSPLEQRVTERAKSFGAHLGIRSDELRTASAFKEELVKAGFSDIQITEELKTFWHENAEAWWESLWGRATRARLEQLSSNDLSALKKEILADIEPGKMPEERHVFYGVAAR